MPRCRVINLNGLRSVQDRPRIRGWFFSADHESDLEEVPEPMVEETVRAPHRAYSPDKQSKTNAETRASTRVRTRTYFVSDKKKPFVPPPPFKPLLRATSADKEKLVDLINVPLDVSSRALTPAPHCVCRGVLKDFKTPVRSCSSCSTLYHEVCVRFNWRPLSRSCFKFICPKCRPLSYFFEYQELLLPATPPLHLPKVAEVLSAVPFSRFVKKIDTIKIEDVSTLLSNSVLVCCAPDCFNVITREDSTVVKWKRPINNVSSKDYATIKDVAATNGVEPMESSEDDTSCRVCSSCSSLWDEGELCTCCHKQHPSLKEVPTLPPDYVASQRVQCSLCTKFCHLGCAVSLEGLDPADLEDFYACSNCRETHDFLIQSKQDDVDLALLARKLFADSPDVPLDAQFSPNKQAVQVYTAVSVQKIVSDLQSRHEIDPGLIDRVTLYHVIGLRFPLLNKEDKQSILSAIFFNIALEPLCPHEQAAFISLMSQFNPVFDPKILLKDLSVFWNTFAGFWNRPGLPFLLPEVEPSLKQRFAHFLKTIGSISTEDPTSTAEIMYHIKQVMDPLASVVRGTLKSTEDGVVDSARQLLSTRTDFESANSETLLKISKIDKDLLEIEDVRRVLRDKEGKLQQEIDKLMAELGKVRTEYAVLDLREATLSDNRVKLVYTCEEELLSVEEARKKVENRTAVLRSRQLFFNTFSELCTRYYYYVGSIVHLKATLIADRFFLKSFEKVVADIVGKHEKLGAQLQKHIASYNQEKSTYMALLPNLTKIQGDLSSSASRFKIDLSNSLLGVRRLIKDIIEYFHKSVVLLQHYSAPSIVPPQLNQKRDALLNDLKQSIDTAEIVVNDITALLNQ
ncbi:hypothetical protein RCL1_006941 [Eukaryota sp. TZLM3-RCL]